jgi:hypothetical protein
MVVIGVIEPVAGSKKQTSQDKNGGESEQNQFDIHRGLTFF